MKRAKLLKQNVLEYSCLGEIHNSFCEFVFHCICTTFFWNSILYKCSEIS